VAGGEWRGREEPEAQMRREKRDRTTQPRKKRMVDSRVSSRTLDKG
jgi:hypothetical protein